MLANMTIKEKAVHKWQILKQLVVDHTFSTDRDAT